MTALIWRRSSFSNPNDCVELAWPTELAAVRDSKNPAGSMLIFDRERFADFLADLTNKD